LELVIKKELVTKEEMVTKEERRYGYGGGGQGEVAKEQMAKRQTPSVV
jgi:hypothetical protein